MSQTVYTLREATRLLEGYLNPALGNQAPAVMLWGPPGVGKSSILRSYAQPEDKKRNYFVKDIRLSLLAPTDLRGLPTISRKTVGENGEALHREEVTTRWAQPGFLPNRDDVLLMKQQGYNGMLILLDEANSAPGQTQAAAYQLVLDRAVGEYTIPEEDDFPIFVVLAGNRASDKGIVHQMPSPLLNRMGHIEIGPDIDEFCQYGMVKGIDSRILAYLRYHGSVEKLLKLPETGQRAFPSPRSWEMVSKLIKGKDWSSTTKSLAATMVGEGPAAELGAHVEVYDKLPDLNAVLDNGLKQSIKKENLAFIWTFVIGLTSTLIARVLSGKYTDQNITNWVDALATLDPEYTNLGMTTPLKSDNTNLWTIFVKNKAYQKWTQSNADVLL